MEQNFEHVAKCLPRLARLGYPILVGPSRKSFIRRTLEQSARPQISRGKRTQAALAEPTAEEILFGTAAALTAAILNGAHIVRVHDVRQMLPAVRLADRLLP